jgi:heme-degrading monooxygenase HmoA
MSETPGKTNLADPDERSESMELRFKTQDGCIDKAITADSLDPTRSNIIEIWRGEQAWKAWQSREGPRSRAQETHFVALSER